MKNQSSSFKIDILASYVKVWYDVAVLGLPVARTCSYRHRTVVMVTGRSSRKHTGPRYPKSFSLMRCLLHSETRSLLRILYKTWTNGKELVWRYVTRKKQRRIISEWFSPWRRTLGPRLRSSDWAVNRKAAPRPSPTVRSAPARDGGYFSVAHTAHPRPSPSDVDSMTSWVRSQRKDKFKASQTSPNYTWPSSPTARM